MLFLAGSHYGKEAKKINSKTLSKIDITIDGVAVVFHAVSNKAKITRRERENILKFQRKSISSEENLIIIFTPFTFFIIVNFIIIRFLIFVLNTS